MEFICVVCSKPADVYCHNDNAYLCAACDVTVHSAHALAASHVRTPVHCNVNYTNGVHPPADAVSNQILAPEPVQEEQKDEISFDADDWFAVPDVVTGDTKEVQSTSLRGKDDKLGSKRKEDSFDIDFSCVPWDIPLGEDPLDLSFDLPLGVPSLDSDLVPSVPSSPGLELDGEVPVDQDPKERKTVKAEITSESNAYAFSHPSESRSAHGKEHLDDSVPELVFDAFQESSDIPELNVDIPPPSVQESVKVVPAAVPVPLHAHTWIQTYVPHTLLPTDPAVRAAALQDRRERVARFRAKKNSFHFKKTIRYASRKRYAEKRPRIKGRFARKDEIEAAIKAGVPLVA